jgi:hypothetical protein
LGRPQPNQVPHEQRNRFRHALWTCFPWFIVQRGFKMANRLPSREKLLFETIYWFSNTNQSAPILSGEDFTREGPTMLWTIFAILLILWLLGFSFHVAGGLIHLLLVAAVIVLIVNLITGRRTVV